MNVQPGLVCGRSNSVPLTGKGELEAAACGKRLKKMYPEGFDEIYASTADRAEQTAKIALGEMGKTPEDVESELKLSEQVLEICMGNWTGQDRKKVYSEDVMAEIDRDLLFHRPPGVSAEDSGAAGESQFDTEQRVAEFCDSIVAGGAGRKDGAVAAVFMHGLAIRCFVRRVLGAAPLAALHTNTSNTSITELQYKPKAGNLGGWYLVRFNDAAHLEGM
jgi:broad specificity phosphatase PhoE